MRAQPILDELFFTARNLVQKHTSATRAAATETCKGFTREQIQSLVDAAPDGAEEDLVRANVLEIVAEIAVAHAKAFRERATAAAANAGDNAAAGDASSTDGNASSESTSLEQTDSDAKLAETKAKADQLEAKATKQRGGKGGKKKADAPVDPPADPSTAASE